VCAETHLLLVYGEMHFIGSVAIVPPNIEEAYVSQHVGLFLHFAELVGQSPSSSKIWFDA
jgi:hypothetical protein